MYLVSNIKTAYNKNGVKFGFPSLVCRFDMFILLLCSRARKGGFCGKWEPIPDVDDGMNSELGTCWKKYIVYLVVVAVNVEKFLFTWSISIACFPCTMVLHPPLD